MQFDKNTQKLKDLQEVMLDKVLEEHKHEYNSTKKIETFEQYTKRCKQAYLAANEEYLHHIENGYEVILNEIAAEV